VLSAPHWHVLGAGAMGCLYAHALQRGGCQATLLVRAGAPVQSLTVVVEHEGARSELQLAAITPQSTASISHLLVTTKAYDARAAVSSVAHLLREGCDVVLLVNGMGLAEQIACDLPHLAIHSGTTTEGAYTITARHIVHAGRGETRIGRHGQRAPAPWFEAWARAIVPSVWEPEIETALWAKLAVNCVINPLTAVNRCCNGELARRPEFATQVGALSEEVARVSRAAGFGAVADSLHASVAGVIAGTANNRSSMLQDVLARRQTEIDYINGYLLQVADRLGIDAPLNRTLLENIKHRDH
jgi:2-dehydropantoate 2-reductase